MKLSLKEFLSAAGKRGWPLAAAVLLAGAAPDLRAAAPATGASGLATRREGEFLPVLKTKTVTYTNVTLRAISDTDLFISHPGGVLNIKLTEFKPESLAAIESVRAKLPKIGAKPEARPEGKKFTLPELPAEWAMDFKLNGQNLHLSPVVVAGVLGGLVLGWLLFCACCRLICLKSAVSPGLLVWLPVVQMFPLLRAAQMEWWWFIIFLIPGLNLIAHIVWSVNIVRVREKGVWLAILLILPVTSILAFFYLACSSGLTVADRHRLDGAVSKRYKA